MLTKLKVMAVLLAAVCGTALGGTIHRAPAADDKARVPAKDATTAKGTLASVDAEKNTVTITASTFDRKTGESTETKKTFPLAKNAKLLQDDVETKLADLKRGNLITITLDGANAVSVTIDGGTMQGQFRTANTERNTITVLAGRNMAKSVYHLLKTTKVMSADGKPVKIEDLKPGTMLLITKSVEDDNTAVRIQAMPERDK